MATEETLVSTVSRAMVRTVAGCLVALTLGVTLLVIALGPRAVEGHGAGRSEPGHHVGEQPGRLLAGVAEVRRGRRPVADGA